MKIQYGDQFRDATPDEEKEVLQTQADARAFDEEQAKRNLLRRAKLAKLGLDDSDINFILGS